MERRDFLGQAVGALAIGGIATACQNDKAAETGPAGESEKTASAPAVHTQKKIRWRLASSFPQGLDTIYGGGEILAEQLKKLSDGRFDVRVYAAGEIVPGLQVLDAVKEGTVPVGHTAGYYYTGKDPALAFDTGVPFGLTQRQQAAWLHSEGKKVLAPLYADFGIVAFPGGHTGCQMGGWFREPIRRARDLKGLKIRIPGIGGKVMTRLGATVQVLAGGDIFPALERGAIDATEWVGPYDDEKLGFYKVAKNYYYPGWWEPNTTLSFYVNQKAWDGLSSQDKALFIAAARYAEAEMTTRYDAQNPPALRRLIENGVKLRKYSDEILEAARKEAFELYAELASDDPRYKTIFDSWNKARMEMSEWFSTSELGYAGFAYEKAKG